MKRAVVAEAIEFPAYDQLRASNELAKRGILISAGGVRSVWLRHDLETFKKCLKALEAKDTYLLGRIKGVGSIDLYYSRVAIVKLYTEKTAITAADTLNERVATTFRRLRVLTDQAQSTAVSLIICIPALSGDRGHRSFTDQSKLTPDQRDLRALP